MEIKIQGKTISQMPEKAELEDNDAFILQDGQETKHAKASALKSYAQQDLSGYATKTELNSKVSTETYNSDKETFATKTELGTKVSGTGLTSIQVVTELPETQADGVLYIVQESEEETA